MRAPRLNGRCGVRNFLAIRSVAAWSVSASKRFSRDTTFSVLQTALTPHAAACIFFNAARERGLVWARRWRGGRRRKTFLEVAQSAVDRFSASPYSPPTHDGHTTASNNSRGMEAAKVLPFQETSNLPTLRRRSSDKKSISHHHTHKEHVSGSIVSGETTVSLTSTLAAAPRSTDASPRFESLPGGSSPTHLESSAQARKRDCVQSLPERFPRPLPPWDVSFSGSFFMRPLKRAGDR